MSKFNKCNICGEKINEIEEHGGSILMAFSIKNTTNMINHSFCKECYEKFVDEKLRALDESAQLGLNFQDD